MSADIHARKHLSLTLPEVSHQVQDVRTASTSVEMCLSNKFPSDNHSVFLVGNSQGQKQRVREIHHEMASVNVFFQSTS